MTVCYYLNETLGGPAEQGGDLIDTVYSGSSKSYSGKGSGTYTYTIYGHTTWAFGDEINVFQGPVSVQVILPIPQVDIVGAQPFGPANSPTNYLLSWTSTNANSCELYLAYYRTGQVFPNEFLFNVATSGSFNVPKNYTNTTHVFAEVTCQGPGGEGLAGINLPF